MKDKVCLICEKSFKPIKITIWISEYLYNNYTSTTQCDEDSPSTIVDELCEYEYDKLGRLTETNIRDKVWNSISSTIYT